MSEEDAHCPLVEMLDHMGDDLTVVNAARVSMAKESEELSDADIKLIRYLATHGHWTPFAHVMFTFRIRMPIFVMRQWYRHTVGIARNEESRRYVDYPPTFFEPELWRKQAEHVKQGSSDEPVENQLGVAGGVHDLYRTAANEYKWLLKQGVCREQARMILPQGMYSQFIETASLYAYARICLLRLDSHAQREVQEYAQMISNSCELIAPNAWCALMDAGRKSAS